MIERPEFICKVYEKYKEFTIEMGKEPNLLILGEDNFKEYLKYLGGGYGNKLKGILDRLGYPCFDEKCYNDGTVFTLENNIRIVRSKAKDELRFVIGRQV